MNPKKIRNLQELMTELIEKADELADGNEFFKNSHTSSINLVKGVPQHLKTLSEAILTASSNVTEINEVEKEQPKNEISKVEELLRW